MSADRPARLELGARLHRVAARNAEVAILHFDALESGLLRVQHPHARSERDNSKRRSNRQFLHAVSSFERSGRILLWRARLRPRQVNINRSVPSFSIVVVSLSPGLS